MIPDEQQHQHQNENKTRTSYKTKSPWSSSPLSSDVFKLNLQKSVEESKSGQNQSKQAKQKECFAMLCKHGSALKESETQTLTLTLTLLPRRFPPPPGEGKKEKEKQKEKKEKGGVSLWVLGWVDGGVTCIFAFVVCHLYFNR